MNICSEKFNDAYTCYYNAYQILGNKMSSKSLHNFFLLSIDVNRQKQTIILLRELENRGWKLESFKNELTSFYPKVKVKELLELYNEQSCSGSLDKKYIAQLDSLVRIDQSTNNYLQKLYHGILDSVFHDTMDALTRQNIACLSKFFTAKFPSDNILGRSGGTPTGLYLFDVLLVHNAQALRGSNQVDHILYKGMINGMMEPSDFEHYIFLHNLFYKNDTTYKVNNISIKAPIFPYDFAIIHDSLFQWPVENEKVVLCNVERKKLFGSCTSEELRQKVIYQYLHPKYWLVSKHYIVRIDFDIPKRIKSHLVFIGKPDN